MFGVDQDLVAALGLLVIAAPLVMYADSCGRRWLLLACTVLWGLFVLLAYVLYGPETGTSTPWVVTTNAIRVIVLALPAASAGIVAHATARTQLPGLVRGALVVVAGIVGLLLAFFMGLSLVCGLTGNCV